MRNGRATHGCAVASYKGGKNSVIVAGGIDFYRRPLKSVEMLIIEDGRWIDLGSMKEPRSWYPAVGVMGKLLVVAAGQNGNGASDDGIEEFDKRHKAWIPSKLFLQWRRSKGKAIRIPANWFPNCIA